MSKPLFDAAGEFERLHVRPRAGKTMIVGSKVYPGREDRRERYADVVGVDMLAGDGVDLVADLAEPDAHLGLFDHIECCSVLEHCRRPWAMAANLERMLVRGGTIHIAAPFIWRPHAYPNDYWRFTPAAIVELFPMITWRHLCFGGTALREPGQKLPAMKDAAGYPFYGRCEVYGFGFLQ